MEICNNWTGSTGAFMEKSILSLTGKKIVSVDSPILDPVFQDVRSRNFQMVTLRCAVLRSNPPRLTDIRWFRNGEFIRMPVPDLKETPELKFKLEPTNNGSYECRVSNSIGTSTCTFNVSSKCIYLPPYLAYQLSELTRRV